MDSNYLIWAESFSWWTLDSVMFCFVISNIDSNTCEIEIISGSEKKGFFKVKTDQGYFATLKFYNKIRNLAKENN